MNRLYRNDAKRPDHAIVLSHRHIVADLEGVLVEPEDRLVVVARPVGEDPAVAMALQLAVLVAGILPETAHSTGGRSLGPFPDIEPAPRVKRRLELVATGRVAVGKVECARQLEADFLKVNRGLPSSDGRSSEAPGENP